MIANNLGAQGETLKFGFSFTLEALVHAWTLVSSYSCNIIILVNIDREDYSTEQNICS